MEPSQRRDGDVNIDVDIEKGVSQDETIQQHTSPTKQQDADEKFEKKKTRRSTNLDSSSDTDTETDDDDTRARDVEANTTEIADSPAGGVLTAVLSRILSRASVKSVPPGPPPDGGFQAWLAVFCAHLIVLNTWGFINSFGIFQTYYATSLSRPPADISWIGSSQIFLLFFVGAFTGRLTDAGYFRPVLFVGSALQIVGIFSSSFAGAGSYWQLFLAQGVCMGLGNGFLFCPTMAVVATYFEKRRAIAIGMVACGTATGGLVFPGMARELLPGVGFAWTIRAIGFIQLGTLVVANVWLRPRRGLMKGGGGRGEILDLGALREVEYLLYMGGSFMFFLGLYFGYYYISAFSRDVIHASYEDSLNLLLVINGVGLPGRLVPNSLADRFGPLTMLIPMLLIGGVAMFSWAAVDSLGGLYAWGVVYGLAAGGIQSLFPAGLASLTADPRKTGVRMGMVFSVCSFATLIGPPIAGAIITASGGRYIGAQAFAASTLLMGMGMMAAARMVKCRKAGKGLWAKI